jgi:hypothetical protein
MFARLNLFVIISHAIALVIISVSVRLLLAHKSGEVELAREQTHIDPNFCHTVFRIAHNLTNVNEAPVAGFTCSQSQESFFITYFNKQQ